MNRRSTLLGLAGAGLPGTRVAAEGRVREGQETWSESAMVLCFSPDLNNGFSLRISRYPQVATTWVWCHVLVDGRLYGFTARDLPCSADRNEPADGRAVYPAPGLEAQISRTGPATDLRAMSFHARLLAHRGSGGRDGSGRVPITLEGDFEPGSLRRNSPEGRYERTGRVSARVSAGGRTIAIAEIAKIHEQTQTKPRFGAPFTYAMLWGPTASLVALMSRNRRYGDFETAAGFTPVERFQVEPWSPRRRFVADLETGERLEGAAETIHKLDVPVFDRHWRGHIVAAEVAGHRMVGMINDWRGEEQPYEVGA